MSATAWVSAADPELEEVRFATWGGGGWGAIPAAPDRVVHLCELVGHSVGDVGAGGCSGISACG
jgi:hypothetical protein